MMQELVLDYEPSKLILDYELSKFTCSLISAKQIPTDNSFFLKTMFQVS